MRLANTKLFPTKLETFDELPQHVLAVAGQRVALHAQPAVEDERDVGGAGRHPEADGAAEGRDQDAGDGRADHPPRLPGDGAERDRVRQIAAVDELRNQRQPARLVERAEGVGQDRQHQQMLEAGDAEHRQDEGGGQGERGEDLRAEQQAKPIGAVGQDAAAELEEHERHTLRQPEVAERQRVVRDLPGQPGEGDVLRPVPQDVEDQPDPVEAIVPPRKGGEGLDHSTVSTALPGKRRAIKSCAT